MTGLGTTIGSLFAAAVVAAGSLLGGDSSAHTTRTAVVIDADLARDGRDLVDPRLRALDAELRLPRSETEARTDVRYFAAQGYRVMVAGPDSRAAANATGVRAAGFHG